MPRREQPTQPTQPMQPTLPTVTAWHRVTYQSDNATTITWDSDGTQLVVPKTKFVGTLRHGTEILETVLQEDTDGNYYPMYRIG